jgi:hypothetical protein
MGVHRNIGRTRSYWITQISLGLQKLYLKDQPRFKGQGDVIG